MDEIGDYDPGHVKAVNVAPYGDGQPVRLSEARKEVVTVTCAWPPGRGGGGSGGLTVAVCVQVCVWLTAASELRSFCGVVRLPVAHVVGGGGVHCAHPTHGWFWCRWAHSENSIGVLLLQCPIESQCHTQQLTSQSIFLSTTALACTLHQ
jgi:hypothetical protein